MEAMVDSDTPMARGLLRPSPTTATVTLPTATARGLLRLSPTTVTLPTATDTTARGLLMPSPLPPPRPSLRLPPTTAVPMADTVDTDTARGPLTPRLTTEAMAHMVDTAMARGPLKPSPTTAMVDTVDMVATAMAMASKMLTSRDPKHPPSQCNTPISKSKHPSQKFYKIRVQTTRLASVTPQFQNQNIR